MQEGSSVEEDASVEEEDHSPAALQDPAPDPPPAVALQLLVLLDQLPLRLSQVTEPQRAFLMAAPLSTLCRRLEPGTLRVQGCVLEVVLFTGHAPPAAANYPALAATFAPAASCGLPELQQAMHAATLAAVLRECPFVPRTFAAFPTPLLYNEETYELLPPEVGVNAATGRVDSATPCGISFPNPALFKEAHCELLAPRVPPFWRPPALLRARSALQLLADYPHEMVHALQSFPELYQSVADADIMLAEHDPSAAALNLLQAVLSTPPLPPLLAAPGLLETVLLYQVREALCTMGGASPHMEGFEARYQAWCESSGKARLVPEARGGGAAEGDDVDTAKIRLSVEAFPRPPGAQLAACFAAGRRGDLAQAPCPTRAQVGTVRDIHEVNRQSTGEEVEALRQRLRAEGVHFGSE